uniref:G_PROTEIN_RECEP_F1_2 domain-containing protein n=1 Tax=Steinernema glaseri TaxID=37863 RepID=A0A1I7XY40_9BILA
MYAEARCSPLSQEKLEELIFLIACVVVPAFVAGFVLLVVCLWLFIQRLIFRHRESTKCVAVIVCSCLLLSGFVN